jgi:hypothetical protein
VVVEVGRRAEADGNTVGDKVRGKVSSAEQDI